MIFIILPSISLLIALSSPVKLELKARQLTSDPKYRSSLNTSMQNANADGFERQCRRILDDFSKGDMKAIASHIGDDGIVIVRNETDLTRNFRKIIEPKSSRGDDTYLKLHGIRAHILTEIRVKVKKSDLSSPESVCLLNQFISFLRTSNDPNNSAYRPALYRVLQSEDEIDPDDLHNTRNFVAVGKLVSSRYWYMYFKNQKGSWKITRLEYKGR